MPRTELHFYEDNIGGALAIIDRLNVMARLTDDEWILRDIAECIALAGRIAARNRARMSARRQE